MGPRNTHKNAHVKQFIPFGLFEMGKKSPQKIQIKAAQQNRMQQLKAVSSQF